MNIRECKKEYDGFVEILVKEVVRELLYTNTSDEKYLSTINNVIAKCKECENLEWAKRYGVPNVYYVMAEAYRIINTTVDRITNEVTTQIKEMREKHEIKLKK